MLNGIPTQIFLDILPVEHVTLFRMEVLGTVLGGYTFGMSTVVFLSTLQVLANQHSIYSRRMRTFLLCYVVAIFLVSLLSTMQQTAFVMTNAGSLRQETVAGFALRPIIRQTYALPFAVWGTDAFLVWRCALIYKGVSKGWKIILFCIIFLATLCSLGSGVFFYFSENLSSTRLYYLPTILLVASSALVNIVLRAAIVGRIIYHQQYIKQASGSRFASFYTKIISMCVESCVMTSLCGALFMGLYFSHSRRLELASVVPLIVLPHTCVVTPLLLVYRAAKGRNVTEIDDSPPGMTCPSNVDEEKLGMKFEPNASTGTTNSMTVASTLSSRLSSTTYRYGDEDSGKGSHL